MSRRVRRSKSSHRASAPWSRRSRVVATGAIALAVAAGWWVSPGSVHRTVAPAAVAARAGSTATQPGTAAAARPAAAAVTAGSPAGRSIQGAGQRVAVDPATGQLRPVEHDEILAQVGTAAVAPDPQIQFGASGLPLVEVPDALHTYTVATTKPDGTLAIEHATGLTDAAARARAAATAAHMGGKEVRNDR